MIVASFFAPREDKWGADYMALLALLDASCRRLGLRHVCISDRPLGAVDALQCRLPDNLMLALLDGQRQCLEWVQGPVLFVGADCLVTRDPREVGGGDLTITTSAAFSDCAMNSGAIWCRRPAACAPVWRAAVDAGPVEWGQDQTALYAAIQASGVAWDEVPAETHNWAPSGPSDDAGMPVVAHFRGRRKAFMPEWAARHLGVQC